MRTRRIKLKQPKDDLSLMFKTQVILAAMLITLGLLVVDEAIKTRAVSVKVLDSIDNMRWEIDNIELPESMPQPKKYPIVFVQNGVEVPLEDLNVKQEACSSKINRFLDTYPNHPWNGRGQQFVDAVTTVAGKEDCEATMWFVAIGCTETSCGRNAFNYNAWGLKGYNCKAVKCSKAGFEMFNSWDESISIVAKRLYRPYLSKKHMDAYRGIYCQSSCLHWENYTLNFLDKMRYE